MTAPELHDYLKIFR